MGKADRPPGRQVRNLVRSAPRASLLGQIEACADPRLAARFLARHPSAAAYAGFADFHLSRMTGERAHLVASFGEIHWLDAEAVLLDTAGCGDLAAAEPDILAHMNEDRADTVGAIANKAATVPAADWSMAGIDPEGADFRSGERSLRVDFETPVRGPEDVRRELVRLARAARGRDG